ncbi:hypothetical protein UPYG_G00124880 [Umbra pygmaea]|uniref:Ig-like domain-containing protein n=1 Tax=Umbra pygmaea TaxID=75934 RepID=A0ABD0X618_UMBPY
MGTGSPRVPGKGRSGDPRKGCAGGQGGRRSGRSGAGEAKSSDSGLYKCLITKIIPPPTQDENYTIDLQVTGLVLKTQNGTDPGCITFICTLENYFQQDFNFTWKNRGQAFPETLLTNHSSSNMSSSLTLCKHYWKMCDTVTCSVYLVVNNTRLNASKIFPCSQIENPYNLPFWVIIVVVISAGVVTIIAVTITIYKCCQRSKKGRSVSYNNKVYENFSFSTRTLQRPTVTDNVKEQCVYEN